MSNHDDAAFIRNFSLVLAGLVVIGLMAFVLAKLVNRNFEESEAAYAETGTAARVAPVGQVNTGGETLAAAGAAAPAAAAEAAPASGADLGKAVYDKACFACHAQGIAGAPKHGDKAAWEPRIAQGRDTLVSHAINGYTGAAGMMPARGGNPSLSDEEVAAGVDYMLGAVGAAAAAPAAEAPAGEAPAEAAPAQPAAAEPSAAAPADTGKGKDVYDAACTVCHAAGVAGAPKLGDKAAWASRIEKGIEALYHSSINGFMGTAGMMPPKGGRPDFADEDVKAAVDYMVSAAK